MLSLGRDYGSSASRLRVSQNLEQRRACPPKRRQARRRGAKDGQEQGRACPAKPEGRSRVRVLIASPLLSYTGASEVEALGATLGELLADLDRNYPGIRFRMIDEQDNIRRHIRFFVNGAQI